jgi:Trypsin
MWCNIASILTSLLIGGTPVPKDTYTYIVDFAYKGQFTCGRMLIDESSIIKSAHCLPTIEDDFANLGSILPRFAATANRVKFGAPGEKLRPIAITRHPLYKTSPAGIYDVAIVKIAPLLHSDSDSIV